MNAETLASVVGVVLSLFFSYVPGVKTWFEALAKERKQAVMGLLLVAVALAVFGLSCADIVSVGITCDKPGFLGVLNVLIAALVANQGIYLLTR